MTQYLKLKVLADTATVKDLPFRFGIVQADYWNDGRIVKEYRLEVSPVSEDSEKLGIFSVFNSKDTNGWTRQSRVFVLVGYGAALYRLTIDIGTGYLIRLHRAELNLVPECNPDPSKDYPHVPVTEAILLTKRLRNTAVK